MEAEEARIRRQASISPLCTGRGEAFPTALGHPGATLKLLSDCILPSLTNVNCGPVQNAG